MLVLKESGSLNDPVVRCSNILFYSKMQEQAIVFFPSPPFLFVDFLKLIDWMESVVRRNQSRVHISQSDRAQSGVLLLPLLLHEKGDDDITSVKG